MQLINSIPTVIDNWDFSRVAEKTKLDLGFDDSYVSAGIDYLKLYYSIVHQGPTHSHGISVAVDPFWHSHILFTEDYADFCNSAFPEIGYLNHFPLLPSTSAMDVERVIEIYTATRQIVLSSFTELPEDIDNWWPDPSVLNGISASACTDRNPVPVSNGD